MFRFSRLSIPGLILVETDNFADNRGYFFEQYKNSEFRQNGISGTFSQESFSNSKKGVIRGLHFQKKPAAQGKLVSVLSGSIFDVAVDIRPRSPHFGKWASVNLSGSNHKSLWVPSGFAHGFASLEDNTLVLYKTTKEYSKKDEAGIIWNDPDLAIKWPIQNPILSEKDSRHPQFKDLYPGSAYKLLWAGLQKQRSFGR